MKNYLAYMNRHKLTQAWLKEHRIELRLHSSLRKSLNLHWYNIIHIYFPTLACLFIFLSLSHPFSLFLYLVSPTIVSLSTYLGVAISLPPISPFLPFSPTMSLFLSFLSLSYLPLSIYFSLSLFLSLSVAFSGPPLAGFIFLCFSLPLSFWISFLSILPCLSLICVCNFSSFSPVCHSLFLPVSSPLSPLSFSLTPVSLSISLPLSLFLSLSLSLSLSHPCLSHSLFLPSLSIPPLSLVPSFSPPSFSLSLSPIPISLSPIPVVSLSFPHSCLPFFIFLSSQSLFLPLCGCLSLARSLFLSLSPTHYTYLHYTYLPLLFLFLSFSLPSLPLFLSPIPISLFIFLSL